MIGVIIGLIFLVILLGVLLWGGQTLLAKVPIAEPFRTVVYVLVVILTVVLVLYILIVLLGMVGIHVPLVTGLK
jgi:hypothetical protein